VFNYEIPNVPEQYVHRIGRTGRAGAAGVAIAFVGDDEKAYLRDIQRNLRMTIPVEPMPADFKEQAAALKKRPALTKEEMGQAAPQQNARKQKGRKSRPAFGEGKKAKTSKHRKGPSVKPNERGDNDNFDRNEQNIETPHKPRNKKKPASNKPSRADRKREGAAARGEDSAFKRKPRRSSGERSEDGQGRPRSKKPRRDNENRHLHPVAIGMIIIAAVRAEMRAAETVIHNRHDLLNKAAMTHQNAGLAVAARLKAKVKITLNAKRGLILAQLEKVIRTELVFKRG